MLIKIGNNSWVNADKIEFVQRPDAYEPTVGVEGVTCVIRCENGWAAYAGDTPDEIAAEINKQLTNNCSGTTTPELKA